MGKDTFPKVSMKKKIEIIGGGTVAHITSHLALSAPAYGQTAVKLYNICENKAEQFDVHVEFTRMAGGTLIETNDDVKAWVRNIVEDLNVKIVFFNCAVVDYNPSDLNRYTGTHYELIAHDFGKYHPRLESRLDQEVTLDLSLGDKIIYKIRQERKDIFLVGFKTTTDATDKTMFEKGLTLCKEASCNLVLVNDVVRRMNMIVTPEEAVYHKTSNRQEALENLVEMAVLRSHLTFTQSTVVEGKLVEWASSEVPDSLRTVVNHCVTGGAYKVFNGSTVGHFACKLSDTEFLTSIRRSNFNELDKKGLVRIKTDGPDTVLAYGAKPSVGGQSQRIVFKDHPGLDCIVHFHCNLKPGHKDNIPVRSQREFECGSHECGKNTSNGLATFGNLKAVMLDQHGPNIVFNKNINPQEVIDFINNNFDLTSKTDGY